MDGGRWSVVRLARLVALAAVFALWAVALVYLPVLPIVHEDEAWIADPARGLAERGVYGAAMFTGYYGMDRHYYEFMPVYPLLLAASFKGFGIGLFQARLMSVGCAALVVALTYAVGTRLFGAEVGALAAWLLLVVRLRPLDLPQVTLGIPLIDVARVARYDVAVPLFGLAAFYVALRWPTRRGVWLVAGLLVGLAGLTHLYGLFWGAALAVWLLSSLSQHKGHEVRAWRALAALVVGVALAWTPWLLYVASGWDDYLAQGRIHADRFDLFSPEFYLTNLTREPLRYLSGLGLGDGGRETALRAGTWLALAGLPLTLAALARRAWGRDQGARALLVVLATQVALFALLLSQKQFSYTATLLPLAAVASAWGLTALWRRGGALRVGAALLVALVAAEGAAQWAGLPARAARTTAYEEYTARVAAAVPRGGRVLGLQVYGLGMRDYDYRSFLVPIYRRDPHLVDQPMPMDAMLDEMQPTAVLIDEGIALVLDPAENLDARGQAIATEFWGWMGRRGARLAAVVDDPTYGRMRVFLTAED